LAVEEVLKQLGGSIRGINSRNILALCVQLSLGDSPQSESRASGRRAHDPPKVDRLSCIECAGRKLLLHTSDTSLEVAEYHLDDRQSGRLGRDTKKQFE